MHPRPGRIERCAKQISLLEESQPGGERDLPVSKGTFSPPEEDIRPGLGGRGRGLSQGGWNVWDGHAQISGSRRKGL